MKTTKSRTHYYNDKAKIYFCHNPINTLVLPKVAKPHTLVTYFFLALGIFAIVAF